MAGQVVVTLPRLLDPASGGRRRVAVTAPDLAGAVDALLEEIPELEVHLFDHTGALRPHVLCFVDGEPTRLVDRSVALQPGAEIRFLQAVSGGSTAGAT